MNDLPAPPQLPLGTHDSFKDVLSWSAETSQKWVAALDLRAASTDQIRLRERLVRLANLSAGETAVEIGCGTGALLCDLARAVGENGLAIGIEPQPALAEAAERRAAGEKLPVIIKTESAEKTSIESETAAACLAQTVLIHLPPESLKNTLAEMTRVVKIGGCVVSCDQDGDTWIIDHPNRELTRRIIRFNSDQRYADGWTGRCLPRLFRAANLEKIEMEILVHADTESASYLFGMAERIAQAAVETKLIERGECREWLAQLYESAEKGDFFSSINYYICSGVRRF